MNAKEASYQMSYIPSPYFWIKNHFLTIFQSVYGNNTPTYIWAFLGLRQEDDNFEVSLHSEF